MRINSWSISDLLGTLLVRMWAGFGFIPKLFPINGFLVYVCKNTIKHWYQQTWLHPRPSWFAFFARTAEPIFVASKIGEKHQNCCGSCNLLPCYNVCSDLRRFPFYSKCIDMTFDMLSFKKTSRWNTSSAWSMNKDNSCTGECTNLCFFLDNTSWKQPRLIHSTVNPTRP